MAPIKISEMERIAIANNLRVVINKKTYKEIILIVRKDKVHIKVLVSEDELKSLIERVDNQEEIEIIFKNEVIKSLVYKLIEFIIIAKVDNAVLVVLKYEKK